MVLELSNLPFPIRYFVCWIIMIYMLISTIVVYPTAVCLVYFAGFLVQPFLSRKTFLHFRSFLARCLNLHFVTLSYFCGVNVSEYGEDMSKYTDERCFLMPNHLGLIDHFIVMRSCDQYGCDVVGRWMFVIYNIWIYMPLGFLWWIHGNYFINTVSPSQRAQQLKHFRDHLDETYHNYDYRWVFMYPEGSRLFLIKERNRQFEKKNNLENLKHCAYPRVGAALCVTKQLGPSKNGELANNQLGKPIKYLIDVTLGYPNAEILDVQESLMKTLLDGDRRMYAIHYEMFEMKEEWNDEEMLKEFLFERYRKKDQLLDEYYKTGKFPGPAKIVEYPAAHLMILNEILGCAIFWMFIKTILFTIFSIFCK